MVGISWLLTPSGTPLRARGAHPRPPWLIPPSSPTLPRPLTQRIPLGRLSSLARRGDNDVFFSSRRNNSKPILDSVLVRCTLIRNELCRLQISEM